MSYWGKVFNLHHHSSSNVDYIKASSSSYHIAYEIKKKQISRLNLSYINKSKSYIEVCLAQCTFLASHTEVLNRYRILEFLMFLITHNRFSTASKFFVAM